MGEVEAGEEGCVDAVECENDDDAYVAVCCEGTGSGIL